MSARFPRPPRKKLQTSQVLRDLRELVWPRRKLLLLGLALVFVKSAAGLVLPGSTKFLIDNVVSKGQRELLLPIAAVVGGAVLVQAVSQFILTQVLSTSAQRLIADMRMRVQQHIGRLPVRYYDANKTGALVSRIMSDVEGVRNLIGTGLVEFIGGLFTATIAFFLLLKINVTMTIVGLVFISAFGFIMKKAFGRIRPMFRERGAINAEVTGRLTESLGGIRVVKGFHAEDREATVFASGAMRLFENIRKTLLAQSIIGLASTVLMGVMSITVMIVGSRMLLAKTMTLGDFFAYTLYMGFMVAPVFQVVGIGSQLTEAFAGLDRVHEVLVELPEDVDPMRTRLIDAIEGHVRFEDVSFEYEAGKPVLQNISLNAVPGTSTALVGPSGSGKSTLIGLVAAFAKPTRGQVFVDDVDLASARLDSYRSQLGVVLQDNFLFDGTIRENVLFGRPTASEEEFSRAVQIARVDEFALRFEHGYETVIGERGVKLSGGQRQRVAIARAILANPRILILDEATSSLDTESEALIQEGLAALMMGRTSFVIAHRLSTIRSADQILVLEDGRIAEQGTHEQLLRSGGRYFELYMKQAGVEANRFINPGEAETVPEETAPALAGENGERQASLSEAARNLLGL
jgi:ABC-type multidrug transport system fused ATPase/permease subunit